MKSKEFLINNYLLMMFVSLFSVQVFAVLPCEVSSVVRCVCDASMMLKCPGFPQAVYVTNKAKVSKATLSLKTADGTETQIILNNPTATARSLYSPDPKTSAEVAAALKARGKVLGLEDRLSLKSVELVNTDDLFQDSNATQKAKTSFTKESARFSNCSYISVVRKVSIEGSQKCAAFIRCQQGTGTSMCSLVNGQCPSPEVCANDQSVDAPEETVSKMLCFTLDASAKLNRIQNCSPQGTVATPSSASEAEVSGTK